MGRPEARDSGGMCTTHWFFFPRGLVVYPESVFRKNRKLVAMIFCGHDDRRGDAAVTVALGKELCTMPKKDASAGRVRGKSPSGSAPAALTEDVLPAAAEPAAPEGAPAPVSGDDLQPVCEGGVCRLPSSPAAPADEGASKAASASASAPKPLAEAPEAPLLQPLAPTLFRAAWRGEVLLVLALIAGTCCARFYRLDHPAGITFDELHFGKFVMWGMNQWFYLCVAPS